MFEDKVRQYLDPRLGEPKREGGQLKYNCPECDKGGKHNLEVCINPNHKNYKKANCHSCHQRGLRTILSRYALDDNWRTEPEFKSTGYEKPTEVSIASVELPENCSSVLHFPEIRKYILEERGISKQIVIERNILYCNNIDEHLNNCIIFPFYEKGKLIGYSSQNFATKKYKNHRDLNFIAYQEYINWNFPVLLTEGIYDALSLPNAVPLMGTKVYPSLLSVVHEKVVIIAMDNNIELPMEEKMVIVEELKKWGAIVRIFDSGEYKDPNEYFKKNPAQLKENLLALFELIILTND